MTATPAAGTGAGRTLVNPAVAAAGVKLLAIAGSIRHGGNSEMLAQAALDGAAAAGAQVELVTLAGKRIATCRGTCHDKCHGPAAPVEPWRACVYKDDAPEVLAKMVEADAVILVAPVFHAGLPGTLRCLMDRCNALSRFADEAITSVMAGKVGGAVAVGGARHGGQEAVLGQLIDFFLATQMIPITLAEHQGYRGVASVAEPAGAVAGDEWVDYATKHEAALPLARVYGAKLAGEAAVVKLGRQAARRLNQVE
ncbi:MAG TPA: flavodoxin family protein [Bacillota bacterium]|jgi:multimeric flavodoxin WrbA